MSKNTLQITEKWIKERIQYTDENLEDIKTLSLPGNYKEKITHLGNSLLHFSRLKELDLSRNALVSLEGLEHLQCLEVLNVYFNQISTLDEICKLRDNTQLRSLDVRLNPLGRNEPDYRLYVIHILTSLTQLDDRRVLDDERRAALMNFSTDAAKEFQKTVDGDSQIQRITSNKVSNSRTLTEEGLSKIDAKFHHVLRKAHPRVQLVDRWKPLSYQLHDGESLKGLTEGDHSKESFNLSPTNGTSRGAKAYQDITERFAAEQKYYWRSDNPISSTVEETPRTSPNKNHSQTVHFEDEVSPNEMDHQTTVLSSRFLEKMDSSVPLSSQPSDKNGWQSAESNFHCNVVNDVRHETLWQEESTSLRLCLIGICDLVDRYWNGRRSLHTNSKFIPDALKILHDYLDVKGVESFNSTTIPKPKQSPSKVPGGSTINPQAVNSSIRNGKDKPSQVKSDLIGNLHQELMKIKGENQTLLQQLKEKDVVTPAVKKKVASDFTKKEVSICESSPYSMEEFDQMRQELVSVKMKLQALEQIAEMAQMLKESHKSLMSTNQQLMNELKEARNGFNGANQQQQPASYISSLSNRYNG